jgi:hypothetical protein
MEENFLFFIEALCFFGLFFDGDRGWIFEQLVWDDLINLLTILSILLEGNAAAKTKKVHFINDKNFPYRESNPGLLGESQIS